MDSTGPRTNWSLRARKIRGQPSHSDTSEAPQPTHSMSRIRSAFTWRKRSAATPPDASKIQAFVAGPEFDTAESPSPTTAPTPHDRGESTTEPTYTSTTLPRRKLTKAKPEAITPSTSLTPKLRHKQSLLDLCLRKQPPPMDILQDIKPKIQATTQKIETKSWCTSLNRPLSLLSLKAILRSEISADTRELLKSGIDDIQEYRKREEEKRRKAEEEVEVRQQLDKTWEVVDSRIVRRGDEYHRCERLVPSGSRVEQRTFDPRARPATAMRSPWVETAGSLGGSDMSSGKIMERPRGIPRRYIIPHTDSRRSGVAGHNAEGNDAENHIEGVIGNNVSESTKSSATMLKGERKRRHDSPLESRRESSEDEEEWMFA